MQKSNMVFFRYPKKENFTVVSNHFIYDPKLTGTAKGLFLFILSCDRKNSGWYLYKHEILKYFKDGKDGINSAFRNLENNGYLEVDQKKKGRKTDLSFTVYEIPKDYFIPEGNPQIKNNKSVCADFPNDMSGFPLEKPASCSENPTLLNTNLINTTTKNSSSSNSIKSFMKDLNITLSDDFYSLFRKFTEERNLSDESAEDYIRWIITVKGKSIRNLNAFIYKTAAERGLYEEYLQDLKKNETSRKSSEPVICKSCGKIQTFQEMREASCRKCGTDYFDFSIFTNRNLLKQEDQNNELDA